MAKGETHQIVDFGPGPKDQTQGYPFEGTDDECAAWLVEHQEWSGKPETSRNRYAMQEIPADSR